MSSLRPSVHTVSSDDDSEASNDSQSLTLAQKESIERNRKKAEELRASKRPLSHEPGTNMKTGPVKISKVYAPTRVVDSGGGFLIEEDVSGGQSSTEIKIVHEPGAILDDDQSMCEACGKPFTESFLMNKFNKSVCDPCKECTDSSAYKLITKTEAKSKYQLKDADIDKREPPLKFIMKKNPRHEKWGEMKLYLESQVAERAVEVHGSEDQIEREKQKKLQKREKAQQKKFDKNVQALRMAMQAQQPTKRHAGHKHDFGPDVYDSDADEYTKTCKTCGHSVTFEKM